MMDPFSHPSLSPSDFFDGLELAHQQQQQQQQQHHHHQQQQQQQHLQHHQHQHQQQLPQHIPQPALQPGPRNYKSRKYRPCDFCRQRQVQCKIEIAPPCQLCASHARECTFVERPKKKKRPHDSAGGESNTLGAIDPALTNDHSAVHLNNDIDTGLPNGFVPQYDEHLFDRALGHEHYIDPQMSPNPPPPPGQPHHLAGLDHNGVPEYKQHEYSGRSSTISSSLLERPLDSPASRSARFIGETGESNPYLLRHYRYDENEECTVSKLTYRRIKKMSQQPDGLVGDWGEPPVVFMLADDSLAKKGEPRIEDDVLAKARHDISSMFTEEEALRLVGLFFRFVNPFFPILARSEVLAPNGSATVEALHAMPLSLISAIYATALPFMLYDDLLATTIVHNPPSAHDLYRISWLAVVNELHTPRLATLQTCLLLLQRAPTNRYTTDTPWKTSLVGWTVSLAQILGLTRECGEWATLPSWEVFLRKRLWYAAYIMDKWASLGAGMPSHIRNEDWDVLPLLPSDCEILGHEYETSDPHFRLLSELTLILSDIMDTFYSLRATQQTAKAFGLSLELARPLRTRLNSWKESLPPALSLRGPDRLDARGVPKLSANPSLSLAYIVATMTLFRALLRPIENLTSVEEEDLNIIGSRNAVRTGAMECAKEVVEFVENLGKGALDAFWHSWSRANFAIASSFLMQLLITSDSPAESADVNDLVHRWRWAMRIGSGNAGSGLMSLGLLRLDGLLLESSAGGASNGPENGGALCMEGGPRGSVGSA